MMSKYWIDIAPDELNRPHVSKIKGVRIDVMLSPFDVPKMARSRLIEGASKAEIEFVYLAGPEPTKDIHKTKGVVFSVGKKSNRLFKIVIDVDMFGEPGFDDVDIQVAVNSLDSLSQSKSSRIRAGNYEAIKDVLMSHSSEFRHQAISGGVAHA